MRSCVPFVVAAALLAATPPAVAQQPTTTRANLGPGDVEANGASSSVSITADGRYVAFASTASNLVTGDTNGREDVFVRDRLLNETTRISVGPGNAQGNNHSSAANISADGRFVAFVSAATNLVSPATTQTQVFLWDRTSGAVRQAAVLPGGYRGPSSLAMSADGGRIVLLAQTQFVQDVFLIETATGAVRRVSEKADGSRGNRLAHGRPAISGDGRIVAFGTRASDFVAGDTNDAEDVIVKDLATGAFERASVSGTNVEGDGHSTEPALDATGCIVAFESAARNLVAGDDLSGTVKAFARDRCQPDTFLLSRASTGPGQGPGSAIDLSADGRLALFTSSGAGVLNPPPPAGSNGLALRNERSGTTSRVDLSTSGEAPASGTILASDLSWGSARYVAFISDATDLVLQDGNGVADVFVRDRATNEKPVARLTVTSLGGGRFTADATGSSDPDGPRVTGQIAWNDGTPPDQGLQATHTYLRAGIYTVTATVTDSDGDTASASENVTVPAGTANAGGTGGATGGDTGAPVTVGARTGAGAFGGSATGASSTGAFGPLVLDRVALSRRSFSVVPRGRRATGRQGASLSLRLSEDAAVELRFVRVERGRRSGSRCVPGRRRGIRCTKRTTAATSTRELTGGVQRIALTGRVGSRTLRAGAYELRIVASTFDGRSASRTIAFSIASGR